MQNMYANLYRTWRKGIRFGYILRRVVAWGHINLP